MENRREFPYKTLRIAPHRREGSEDRWKGSALELSLADAGATT